MNNFGQAYALLVKTCLRLLILALVVMFLVEGSELLIPFTIALFLTFILLPVSQWLERLHFPRGLAIFISILLALVVISAFVFFLYKQMESFSDDFPGLKAKVAEKADNVHQFIREHFDVSKKDQTQWLHRKVVAALDRGDRVLITFLTMTGVLITNLLLIPLYIYFLTLYRDKIKKFISLISDGEHQHVFVIVHNVLIVAQKYLKGLLFDMLIVATVLSAGFLVIEVKHAILFGLLVATCNIILPFMGITIGSVFPFCIVMLTQDHLTPAIAVLGFCCAMQFIDNHFINPYVVGFSVSINPLTAFLALVASALIWGIYGMLLCIPLMGMIKVVCDNVKSLRPYGFIIGQEMEFGQDMEKKKKRIAHKIFGRVRKK